MNICIINGFFPPHVSGSARMAFLLSEGLAKQGHNVIVITSRIAGTESTQRLGNVTIYRVRSMKYPKIGLLHNADLYWTLFPQNFRRVVSILQQQKIEIVQTFGQFHDLTFMAVLACRLLNIPVVLSIAVRMEHPNRIMNGLLLFGEKVLVKNLVARHTSAVVALDKLMKDYIVARYGVREESVPFIPLAVDVTRFENCNGQSIRTLYGLSKSQPIILSLGTISNYRNPSGLIHALPEVLKEFPKLKLLFVGAVQTAPPIRLVNELGLHESVIFAGKVDYAMIPSYLGACDVEGHDLESGLGIGLGSLESMAAGRTVMSSAREDNFMNLGLKNWRNIVIVRPGNVKDISRALTRLLFDRELRKKIGTNARAFVKEYFALDRVTSAYIEEYRRILER